MIQGLYLSAYGMVPRINQQDAIANNLANISTNGYKRTSLFLRKLISADHALDRALGRERTQIPEERFVDFTQGTFDETGNDYHVALNGPGFFRLRDTQGDMFYTRNGRFYLDPNGYLVNNEGMYVLNERFNVIRIQGDNVRIEGNGDIIVDDQYFQTIGLADFAQTEYQQLDGVGAELFRNAAGINEIQPSADTVFLQGFIEDSNVQPIHEMVDMIDIFRMFELGQKSIQIQDQSLQRVVTEVGVVR
jgi:flagellar basal-body rod protein FlgG